MTEKAVVLIVDDEIANIEIMNAILEDEFEVCFATSGEEALKVAKAVLPDLILLDVIMPGIDGYEVCRRIKKEPMLADVPLVFSTGLGDEDAEALGLELGAIDYITKPVQPAILRARVRNHVELKQLRDRLAKMAVTDALTGLSNRRHLEQVLQTETARLSLTNDWLSFIMLDIDFFKSFNDAYGHPVGDRCIAMVAAALNRAVRLTANVSARYGGEEFACVLPQVDPETALEVAADIQTQIRSLEIPHTASSVSPHVTVSVGIASARCAPGMTPDLWVQSADAQLYVSKSEGRNRIAAATFEVHPDVVLPRLKRIA